LNIDSNDIDALIANYLSGEATPEEIAFIDDWRSQNERNQRYFEQLHLIFEKAANVASNGAFDTDQAWQKVRAKMTENRDSKSVFTIQDEPSYSLYWRVAAGVIVLLSIGLFTYRFFRTAFQTVELVAADKMKADTLPNGSGVFLNRQTRIRYTAGSKNTHTAKLEGEAYFDVKHHKDETFIVEADGTFIKDIGTSFNVKAYPDETTIEVVVDEGTVVFYTDSNSGIHIPAKGRGIYNKSTRMFLLSEPAPNVTAYKTRFFSFNNDSLATVVKTLNAVYETQINIGQNLQACRLTVSFNDEKIDEITQIIAETLDLTISRSGNVIRLEGAGCEGQNHE
jgi:transmembrane sensor